MGRRSYRKGRAVHGILLLNKPQGITSNDALQQVKRLYFAEKAGHTGALDPLATGMLPICFGEATKFCQFLLESDKVYQVVAKLGERTNTSDADGEVVERRPVHVTEADIVTALQKFHGTTQQIPSMYSALKYQGRPLYEYAREGIDVPRQSRPIHVYEIQLLRASAQEIELQIHCSKGTYVRTIIDDLGEILGCGAHVTALHRQRVAQYQPEHMITLEQLEQILLRARDEGRSPREDLDPLLLPVDTAVSQLPRVTLIPALADLIALGQAVQVLGAPTQGWVRLFSEPSGQFLGVGEIDDEGRIAPKRLVVTERGAYMQPKKPIISA